MILNKIMMSFGLILVVCLVLINLSKEYYNNDFKIAPMWVVAPLVIGCAVSFFGCLICLAFKIWQ